ncbi:hypothetical protein HYH03_000287 [Edaphochlamys debaryana]|uniref:Uncharacterized protein n=1 Tax=Edaphochlamys debaryana TaxID=47281 RepID=A0A835YH84_9CHLO|nr:hypothetical protein HYH03_000287 [Edaphochlamys debaryana]|eukprot:KAG2501787.1 hypothetical protein HYH03_000287 [Edaphochlamys debaryana]
MSPPMRKITLVLAISLATLLSVASHELEMDNPPPIDEGDDIFIPYWSPPPPSPPSQPPPPPGPYGPYGPYGSYGYGGYPSPAPAPPPAGRDLIFSTWYCGTKGGEGLDTASDAALASSLPPQLHWLSEVAVTGLAVLQTMQSSYDQGQAQGPLHGSHPPEPPGSNATAPSPLPTRRLALSSTGADRVQWVAACCTGRLYGNAVQRLNLYTAGMELRMLGGQPAWCLNPLPYTRVPPGYLLAGFETQSPPRGERPGPGGPGGPAGPGGPGGSGPPPDAWVHRIRFVFARQPERLLPPQPPSPPSPAPPYPPSGPYMPEPPEGEPGAPDGEAEPLAPPDVPEWPQAEPPAEVPIYGDASPPPEGDPVFRYSPWVCGHRLPPGFDHDSHLYAYASDRTSSEIYSTPLIGFQGQSTSRRCGHPTCPDQLLGLLAWAQAVYEGPAVGQIHGDYALSGGLDSGTPVHQIRWDPAGPDRIVGVSACCSEEGDRGAAVQRLVLFTADGGVRQVGSGRGTCPGALAPVAPVPEGYRLGGIETVAPMRGRLAGVMVRVRYVFVLVPRPEEGAYPSPPAYP